MTEQLNMRAKILACIEPHWKDEWKLATRKLAASIFADNMVICGDKCIVLSQLPTAAVTTKTGNSVDTIGNSVAAEMRFDFRGIERKDSYFGPLSLVRRTVNASTSPSYFISFQSNRTSCVEGDNYIWEVKDGYYGYGEKGYRSVGSYNYESTPFLVRKSLSMEQVPYSLWYRILNAMSPLAKCSNLNIDFNFRIYSAENQAYIPPQHFNPALFKTLTDYTGKTGSVVTGKWMSMKEEQRQNYNGEIDYRQLFLNGGTHELTIKQVMRVYQLMFRYNRVKLALATTAEMFQCIFENVYTNSFGRLACSTCHSLAFKRKNTHLLRTIAPSISIDGKTIKMNMVPVIFDDGIIPPTLTFIDNNADNCGEQVQQLKIADHFSCEEFTQMTNWALKVHEENDELMSDKGNLDRTSINYFPSVADHFDDFDNVRGLLATTSVYSILQKYQSTIDLLQSSLESDPSHKPLPSAVAELVGHYVPLNYQKVPK